MKVCEQCGGVGHLSRVLCDGCAGTGMVLLGPEGLTRYTAMLAAAREKAAREGWQEIVWEGQPGNARKVKRRVTVPQQEQSEVA